MFAAWRSYDYTGWLVEALTANLVDFLPFLFLVFLLVTTFGFIFLLLFTPAIDRARSEAAALLAAADSPTLAAVVETGASFAPDETGFGDVLQARARARDTARMRWQACSPRRLSAPWPQRLYALAGPRSGRTASMQAVRAHCQHACSSCTCADMPAPLRSIP